MGAVVVMGITILYRRRRDRHHLVVMLLTSKDGEGGENFAPSRRGFQRTEKAGDFGVISFYVNVLLLAVKIFLSAVGVALDHNQRVGFVFRFSLRVDFVLYG